MVDTIGDTNAVASSPMYSGRMLRQSRGVYMGGATATRPLGARSGVRPGTSATTVTVSGLTWTCGPFAGLADVETAAEAGAYPFSFDAATTASAIAAQGGNARSDLIVVQVDDPSESDGTSIPAVRRLYVQGGTTGPTDPTLPARSFPIARINVPASGGGAPTVTWIAPYATAAGAALWVLTKAQLDLIPGSLGSHATVFADTTTTLNGDYVHNGTSWQRSVPFAMASGTVANSGTGVSNVGGVAFYDALVVVNFPSGRFTVVPHVTVTFDDQSAGSVTVAQLTNTTLTQASMRAIRFGAAPPVGVIRWTAVQMTPTSAAG